MSELTLRPTSQGKVRDIYDLGDRLLLVATDRISAFDYILEDEIPYKGQVLTQLSLFWFDLLSDVMDNHLISADIKDLPAEFKPYADYLDGRFMIVRKLDMFPAECIVRGYLTGSGLKEYRQHTSVCGIPLPEGLVNASKLPNVLFTPSTKADLGDHDENVSFEVLAQKIGEQDAQALEHYSTALYEKAAAHALEQGIIIADTKFEFGRAGSAIILGDEVLTPDSSRFWDAAEYQVGLEQASFDKQFVRNWLKDHWDFTGAPPKLPQEVIEQTSQKYIAAYERITGKPFPYSSKSS